MTPPRSTAATPGISPHARAAEERERVCSLNLSAPVEDFALATASLTIAIDTTITLSAARLGTMAELRPDAPPDEIEEEILFYDVLAGSLDPGADDYAQQLAGIEATKQNLQRRLEASSAGDSTTDAGDNEDVPGPSIPAQTDGHSEEHDFNAPYTRPAGPAPYASTQTGGAKRSMPSSFSTQHDHPSKRGTPEHSSGSTPTSSSSFEFIDHPSRVTDRAKTRQLAAEASMWKRRAEQQADEDLARRLSQTPVHNPSPAAGPSSSQRPGVQTTIGHNGSFSRPPPPPPRMSYPSETMDWEPRSSQNVKPDTTGGLQQTPRVKAEPSPSFQQSTRRSGGGAAVVDLTGDDSDDEPSEVPPNAFTPSRPDVKPSQRTKNLLAKSQRPPMSYPPPPQYAPPMPGAFPGMSMYPGMAINGQQIPIPYQSRPQPYGQPSPYTVSVDAYGTVTTSDGRTFQSGTPRRLPGKIDELSRLIPGSSSRPHTLFDDDEDDCDDVQYGGSRPINPYLGYEDIYRRRFEQIQEHDPQKTKEEINDLLNNIRPDEDVPDELLVPTPEAMSVRLHKYQELGLTWLKKCEEGTNKGGILADDMGLGKTIQMLSLLVSRKSDDPRCKTTLIIAPVALLRQWKQEIQQKIKPGRHALTVFIHHGASKKKTFRDLQHYDVVLTTYGSLASEVKKMEAYQLRKIRDPDARPNNAERCALVDPDAYWYRVILDEAQCIKNRSTQTAKGACMVNAKYRFCMTGTPMMNNIEELYSLIHFLRIKPYCQWEKFRFDFVTPLKSNFDEHRQKSMRMLQTLCRAIMLRRTKSSKYQGRPILVLPERTTEVEHSVFNEDEDSLYKALESKTAIQFNKYVKAGTVGRSYTAILVLLLRLRQACCHPHLIKDFSVSEAAGVAIEDMIKLAEQLEPQVVARIKETGGNFECPICMDACTNPAIFLPCGHDTCRDCFVTLSENHLTQGDENNANVRCPECRGNIDTKRITDFDSFKKVHMRELLSKEELENLEANESQSESDDSDSDSEDESVDDTLDGFIVKDDAEEEPADSSTESEAEEEKLVPKAKVKGEGGADDEEYQEEGGVVGPVERKKTGSSKDKKKGKKSKKPKKKAKGKGKANKLTLADLKKLSTRSVSAKKKYLRKLRKSFVSSAKIDKMMDLLYNVIENADDGAKILVFSQWTSLLDLAEVPIEEKGWGYRRYDGSMNAKMRGDAVDDFKDARKDVRVMLVSLKAGNAGLNLNVASQVIILDPFWNPYIEEQAIDRAHRIGQARPVKVHRVLVEGTVEDRIIELQDKKRALIEEALDEKEHQNISRLGVQELAYLFGVTRNANERVQYQERRRDR